MNKWDCIKLKSFYPEKEIVTRLKRETTKGKSTFMSYSSGKGLISRIYRELKNSTPEESTPQRRNGHMN
jgi:hypothetical protein